MIRFPRIFEKDDGKRSVRRAVKTHAGHVLSSLLSTPYTQFPVPIKECEYQNTKIPASIVHQPHASLKEAWLLALPS